MKTFNCLCPVVILVLLLHGAFPQPACGPCQCHLDSSYSGGIKAVCSDLKLTVIPSLPVETTTLLMDNNNLTDLPPRPFSGLKKLKHLDMSDMTVILGKHVFDDLLDLEILFLNGTDFTVGCSQHAPVFFKPLKSLITLSVFYVDNQCNHHSADHLRRYSASSYPESLQNLYIDCSLCRFKSSFLRLKNLSLLSFAPNSKSICIIDILDDSYFKYMPYLTTLNMSNCQASDIKPGMLYPLQHLRKLDMSMYINVPDEFGFFMEVIESLRSPTIEYIKFASFYSAATNPDLFLCLHNTTLKELNMVATHYPIINSQTFEKLPQSLEIFIFNRFQYENIDIFDELSNHPTLKTLDLSGAVYLFENEEFFTLLTISPLLETFICKGCPFYNFLNFRLSEASPDIMKKRVKRLIIPDNAIAYISSSICQYLPYIEHIDVSKNRLNNLPRFSQNNSISYLDVAGNRLGNFLASDNISTFESLSKLQSVDFSGNNAYSISTYSLDQLHRARIINVSNNYLETVNFRLIHLTNLEVLDLSNNKIHAIGEDTRNDLSYLPKATLRLDGNPLVCGCDELDSLQWMKQNRKRVHNLKCLNCRLSTGKHESLSHLDEIITNLQPLCKSTLVEISVSVSVTVSVLILVAGVLVYRHRWKLRYLYYAGRRGYRRRYNREYIHLEDYQFDAFISYADPDRQLVFKEMIQELEEKHGLKLCVHHRDFLPGEVISDNIVNAIQNSRKTVVVLSPSFLKSDWCEFEFNMARMEGVTRREDIVLMLLYEDVSMMNLSKDMASMLKRNCYLEYNHELFNKDIFWYNVQESIKTIRQRE